MDRRKVRVEGKCPVTRATKHTATAPVDVCLTPQGPTFVPVPYVNTAKSQDLTRGSRRVHVAGASVMLKGSRIACSMGNAMGVGGGVKSKTTLGPCRAVQTSRLVRIENQAVVLGGAVTLQNGDNAVGSLSR